MPGARAAITPLEALKSFGDERWKIKITHQSHLSNPVVSAALFKGERCNFAGRLLSPEWDAPAEIDAPGEETCRIPSPPLLSCFSPWGISLPCCSKDRIRDLHTGVTPAGAAGAQPSPRPHSSQCSQSLVENFEAETTIPAKESLKSHICKAH